MTKDSRDTAPTSLKAVYGWPLLTSALLYASFFPLNLGWLGWIALTPLLTLVRANARPRHIYLAASLSGLAFYVPALQWVRVAHVSMHATWAALCVIAGVYFPLTIAALRALDRRGVSLLISLPSTWVFFEYVRAHFPTGFAWMEPLGIQHRIGFGWYFLGYTQHDFRWLIQVADLGGVYAVSFLTCLANAALFTIARDRPKLGPALRIALVAGLPIVGAIVYGAFRVNHSFTPGPRVALLQSDVPQMVKMTGKKRQFLLYITRLDLFPFEFETVLFPATDLDVHMAGLLYDAYQVPPDRFPDLVIWPETTCDVDWVDFVPGADRSGAPLNWLREHYESMAFARFMVVQGVWKSPQLLGLNGLEWEAPDKAWKFNSAKFIHADGAPGPRYDKMHLVPFGEYVPLKSWFPWLQKFTPYTHEYSCKPGEHWTRFPLDANGRTTTFGAVICYEDSDPALARRYAVADSAGPAVDFLVNISNDGWFNGTEEHEQHLAICRFRAVECRRAVVRSVNMGISTIIDGNGDIVALPASTWADSVKIAGVVNGVVPIDNRGSLFARLGDWLPLLCGATLMLAYFSRRRAG
jgi:apolipoprotein N-acyltransferase